MATPTAIPPSSRNTYQAVEPMNADSMPQATDVPGPLREWSGPERRAYRVSSAQWSARPVICARPELAVL
jgi:hypothetical protein